MYAYVKSEQFKVEKGKYSSIFFIKPTLPFRKCSELLDILWPQQLSLITFRREERAAVNPAGVVTALVQGPLVGVAALPAPRAVTKVCVVTAAAGAQLVADVGTLEPDVKVAHDEHWQRQENQGLEPAHLFETCFT